MSLLKSIKLYIIHNTYSSKLMFVFTRLVLKLHKKINFKTYNQFFSHMCFRKKIF